MIQYLTQAELSQLFKAIPADNRRDRAIFLIAYRHGLRASEVGLLTRDDVDLRMGKITAHRLKGSHRTANPLMPDEIKVLRSYLRTRQDSSRALFLSREDNPISRFTLAHLMRAYGEKAEIPAGKCHFHALKHSIATHLFDAGMGAEFVQAWLGHANIQNTMVYAKLSPASKEERARKAWASKKIVGL